MPTIASVLEAAESAKAEARDRYIHLVGVLASEEHVDLEANEVEEIVTKAGHTLALLQQDVARLKSRRQAAELLAALPAIREDQQAVARRLTDAFEAQARDAEKHKTIISALRQEQRAVQERERAALDARRLLVATASLEALARVRGLELDRERLSAAAKKLKRQADEARAVAAKEVPPEPKLGIEVMSELRDETLKRNRIREEVRAAKGRLSRALADLNKLGERVVEVEAQLAEAGSALLVP